MTLSRCSKEQKKEQSITSRSAHTSVVQAGPANHSANACKLANADQELTYHLSQHASKHLPHWFPSDSPLILTNPGVWWTSWLSNALFDVWADPALRDRGPCAVSMKAIKKLNSCHSQNRPCIHFFFCFNYFFLSFPLAKWRSELFWLVFALKKTISMRECVLTQLAVCIQILIAVVCVRQTSSDVPLVFARGSRKMTLVARMRRRVYKQAAMQQSPGDWSHLFQTRLGS